MEMDKAVFLNKYMETLTEEVATLKKNEVLQKTQVKLLEEATVDLEKQLKEANEEIAKLSGKEDKTKRTPKKKLSVAGADNGGSF